MLRDGHVERTRVAAHDDPVRDPLERHLVHARYQELDEPQMRGPRGEVLGDLGTEALAHEDVRGRPGRIPSAHREIVDVDGLESPAGPLLHDGASDLVHGSGEKDPGHRSPQSRRGYGPFGASTPSTRTLGTSRSLPRTRAASHTPGTPG